MPLRIVSLFAALVFSLAAATTAPAAELTMEERIDLLDLISRYSHTWDGRKNAEWVDLFTDDAVIKASFRGQLAWSHDSKEARANFIETFYADAPKAGILQTRHFQTNTMFAKQPDGTVHADTMFAVTFQFKGQPAPSLTNTGIYRDRFKKTKDGWKFTLRDILVDQDPPPAN